MPPDTHGGEARSKVLQTSAAASSSASSTDCSGNNAYASEAYIPTLNVTSPANYGRLDAENELNVHRITSVSSVSALNPGTRILSRLNDLSGRQGKTKDDLMTSKLSPTVPPPIPSHR
jgi:hypothetical protein